MPAGRLSISNCKNPPTIVPAPALWMALALPSPEVNVRVFNGAARCVTFGPAYRVMWTVDTSERGLHYREVT